jgi:hypothetical protein
MMGPAHPNRSQIKQYKRKADKGELAASIKIIYRNPARQPPGPKTQTVEKNP